MSVLGPVDGLDDALIEGGCVLAHPLRAGVPSPLSLGRGVLVRSLSVLYQRVTIGAGTEIGHGTLVREDNVIGERCSIGSGAQLEPGNRIGNDTRVHSGCFLSSVTLGDHVFCGPHVVFTDDPHPPCPMYLECAQGVVVEDGASIGAHATVLPGVRIGAGCLVGAGAVVTRSVPAGAVVVGNPARVVGVRNDLACTAALFQRAYAWTESS